jgi:peptide alpha-N-acetyltransferase
MQNCNLWCLPENYHFNYYLYHYLTWSELLHVAEENGQVCGYVLAKMDDDSEAAEQAAHITSLSVLRTHRRLGLANKLMNFAHDAMELTQESDYVSLHVRVSNRAALGLYQDRLGYRVADTEVGYYADGENAYQMRKDLVRRGFPKAEPHPTAVKT